MAFWMVLIDDEGDNSFSGDIYRPAEFHCYTGMAETYDSTASPGKATITIPATEINVSNILAKRLRIAYGTAFDTHTSVWEGYIQYLEYDPPHRNVIITAYDYLWSLSQYTVQLSAEGSQRADQIIDSIIAQISLPLWDISNAARLNEGHYPDGSKDVAPKNSQWNYAIIPEGQTTFDYVGDHLGAGKTALQAIQEAVDSEQGVFYQNSAYLGFINRHGINDPTPYDAQFDATIHRGYMTIAKTMVNHIDIAYHERIAGTPKSVLWQIEEPIIIRAGKTRYIRATFADSSLNRIGATDIIAPLRGTDWIADYNDWRTIAATDRLTVSIDQYGSSGARLALINHTPYDLRATTLQIRGTPLIRPIPLLTTELYWHEIAKFVLLM